MSIEKEFKTICNKNPPKFLCPSCRKNNWEIFSCIKLEWKCLNCSNDLAIVQYSKEYLTAYWAGYNQHKLEISKENKE